MTNSDEFAAKVKEAAEAAGEKMWQLPTFEEYKKQLKSDYADMKNTGGRPAGTITAALFLAEFAEETPWVHLDIAGTADGLSEPAYQPNKGSTGVPTRTLARLAIRFGERA